LKPARRIPKYVWPIVRRKLDQIDAVTKIAGRDQKGQHAMRANDQFRIVFRFEGADAFDVRCTDYHRGH
jgi:plasmid maintenance system killer protein